MNTSYIANKLLYENENNFWNDNNDYYSTPNPQTPRTQQKEKEKTPPPAPVEDKKVYKMEIKKKEKKPGSVFKNQNLTTT